jgi:hypothetical protein
MVQKFDSETQYNIFNGMTGFKLTERNGLTSAPGACDTHSAFSLLETGHGYFQILNGKTNAVIDVYGAAKHNLATIFLFQYHGGDNQQWEILPTDRKDHFKIKSKDSGFYLSWVDHMVVQEYNVTNSMSQIWHIVPATNRCGLVHRVSLTYTIKSKTGGFLGAVNGFAVMSTENNKWTLHETKDDNFYCYNQGVNLMLDVEKESMDDGALLCLWKTNSKPNQQFKFIETGQVNEFKIQAQISGKYLSCRDGNVCQYGHNGSDNQIWIVTYE